MSTILPRLPPFPTPVGTLRFKTSRFLDSFSAQEDSPVLFILPDAGALNVDNEILHIIHNSYASLDCVITSMTSCFGQNLAIPNW